MSQTKQQLRRSTYLMNEVYFRVRTQEVYYQFSWFPFICVLQSIPRAVYSKAGIIELTRVEILDFHDQTEPIWNRLIRLSRHLVEFRLRDFY